MLPRFANLIIFLLIGGAALGQADGPIARYSFDRVGDGKTVTDLSGHEPPLHLTISDPEAVRWEDGTLVVTDDVVIAATDDGAGDRRLHQTIVESGALTVEAWLTPSDPELEGPARIITFSQDTLDRNFTLGQEGDSFDFRLRTTRTEKNGMPSMASPGGSLTAGRKQHVVYAREAEGKAVLYVDGRKVGDRDLGGDLSPWDPGYRFALGNELTGDRPWRGTFHELAIFSRALSAEEVAGRFTGGGGKVEQPNVPAPPAAPAPAPPASAPLGDRVTDQLAVLYTFAGDSVDGIGVRDLAGTDTPIDLYSSAPEGVGWHDGMVELRGGALESDEAASPIIDAVRSDGELTVEAWLHPADTSQEGPARIVTLSDGTSNRNFTLGQEGGAYDLRFRSEKKDKNGLPSLSTPGGSVQTALTHLAFTRASDGTTRLFLSGEEVAKGSAAGNTQNWDQGYRLTIGNETSGDRPWRGQLHLVALYTRALEPEEIAQNFGAGAGQVGGAIVAEGAGAPAGAAPMSHFEEAIAPLFAQHCLECHDAATTKGKLDLSRGSTAFANREGEPTIVPGQADQSLVWQMIADGEMPPDDRKPLSDEEAAQIKAWIDGGAAWEMGGMIDPADYLHGGAEGGHFVRRLTVPEYIATVSSTLGIDIAAEATELLPPDLRADGFSNTAYNLTTDLAHIRAYADLARIIVDRTDVPAFAKRFDNNRSVEDKKMRPLLEKMGQWVLRGRLASHELDSYRGITTAVAATGGDFDESIAAVLGAMLQSPRFVYRIEDQRGEGKPVNDFELASRLSYALWGTSPDRELARSAEQGRLRRRGEVERQVRRMLDDDRADEQSLRFASEWLDLGRLSSLNPNRETYPQWTPEIGAAMRGETLAFWREVVLEKEEPLSEIFRAQVTHVPVPLAQIYGLSMRPEGAVDLTTPVRYDLTGVKGRGGILTQGSVLTIGGDGASMVTRGLFVLHDLLRGVVRDPPPGTDTTPIPSEPGLTQRRIAEGRIADKDCGACHEKFEPLAFGLERFDGIGAYREVDVFGNKLREDGEILIPGEAEAVAYATTDELMDLLAESDRVAESLTRKIVQFSLGRPLASHDVPALRGIHRQAQEAGGTYRDIMAALALSDLMRIR